MNEALKTLLSLSLSGTLLFILILAIKPLYKNRFSKRWQYYIWLMVIFRMLLPFAPQTSLVGAAFGYLDDAIPAVSGVQWEFGSDDTVATPNATPQVPNPNADTTPSSPGQGMALQVYQALWILWAAIAFALFIRKMTLYQSFVRFVKAGRTEVSDTELLNMLADVGEQIGMKRPVELFVNPLIASPMMLGFFRPYIILPTIDLEKTELAYIMRHELTHYRHLDMFYKWLVQLTVCLHWFNPFAYGVAKEINKCCELACDEAIIKTMDVQEKKAYGDTLLNALKVVGKYNNKLAAISLTEGAEQLKERLAAIMKFKKASKSTISMMLALTLVLTVGATAIGAYAATPDNPASDSPWSVMGGPSGQPYTYSQESYYQAPYIFEIGRNLNEWGQAAYPDKTTITLADQTTMTLSFDESCKQYAKDEPALAALKPLMERLIKTYADSALPMQKPLIVSVHHTGGSDLNKLAEEYYTSRTGNKFYAIFSSLEEAVQKDYCTRMIAGGETALLAGTARVMNPDMLNFCLEQTYQEGKIALFAGIVPNLTYEQIQIWIARASRDGKNNFLAVLTRQSPTSDQAFLVLARELSSDELLQLAEQLYENHDVQRFKVIWGELPTDALELFLKRAYQENNTEFVKALKGEVSPEQIQELLLQ